MSAASIKRGGGGAVRKPRATIKGKVKGKPKPSLLAKTVAAVPISAAAMQRIVTVSILGVAGAALIAIAMMLGLPAYASAQIAELVGNAGFSVKRVEVTGIDRMDRLTVYAVALDQKSRAMPLVDLDKVRGELLQYGWIADARVSRRLPDTLVVDIVERKPAAVWQHEQQLSLIDDKGVVLEPVALDAMPDLPLVIGPDANIQATALTDLMSHALRLKPMLAGATWVGNRRWDLRFQSGEVLALPEGDAPSAKALAKFAAMDGLDRLLGRGFVRFDMRDPAKMFVRVGRDKATIDKPVADGNDQHNEGGIA
ncbi:cell division protein FtsQ/DivIB [Sphingomonas sp.]|uniref:cell division protein FtsQ/DivIB n=1 Tax=Sphingomonas sp. TaxID=28214 RepID=UPI0025EAFC8B|nr:cell division protein FtsQ/DivIB [Sphingomonas sp.]